MPNVTKVGSLKLSDAEKLKLWDYLRLSEAQIQAERPAVSTLMAWVKNGCGLEITHFHIEAAIRAGVIKDWEKPGNTGSHGMSAVWKRLREQDERIAGLVKEKEELKKRLTEVEDFVRERIIKPQHQVKGPPAPQGPDPARMPNYKAG